MQVCGVGDKETSSAAAMNIAEVLGSRPDLPGRAGFPSLSCWGFGSSWLLPVPSLLWRLVPG